MSLAYIVLYHFFSTRDLTGFVTGNYGFKKIIYIINGVETPCTAFVTNGIIRSSVKKTVIRTILIIRTFVTVQKRCIGRTTYTVVREKIGTATAIDVAAFIIVDSVGSKSSQDPNASANAAAESPHANLLYIVFIIFEKAVVSQLGLFRCRSSGRMNRFVR